MVPYLHAHIGGVQRCVDRPLEVILATGRRRLSAEPMFWSGMVAATIGIDRRNMMVMGPH
jgi:hypothetical protein